MTDRTDKPHRFSGDSTVLTYGDLPESTLKTSAFITCANGCDEGYAASRGDYWQAAE